MTILFETARLRCREFKLTDAPFIVELLNSEGWLTYIGDRNVKTEEDARKYLENGPMKSYSENGFGLSMVERKDDGEPLGMMGLLKRDFLAHVDIGFAFLPQHQNKGYAVEAAKALLQHAKQKLHIETVDAITKPNNIASIKLLEKIGLFLKEPMQTPYGEKVLVYSTK